MSADSDAFQTVKQLSGLTPVEQQYLLTVARGEGFYGLGWGNPGPVTIKLSEQFGIDPRAGEGSNNWGAEQGQGDSGSFPHVDHHADGSPYVEQYKKHSTAAKGAASVARILLKPNLRKALITGIYEGERRPLLAGKQLTPLEAAVLTQYENRYFELDPTKYTEAAKRNYAKLTANLKWPNLLGSVASPLAPGEESPGQSSLEPDSSFSGSPPPEAGFLRGQKFSVPGVQDEPEKK